ncbi:hypothetical protein [Sediminivirga luteola]|nr:hypothetical protein [Sediminivirga luteola]MCI2264249.1 hypothetical protein [Sediminivirga luteola]
MLTDFVRDHAFTIAWFGLMAFVWFGWGQEDPPRSWRWKLGLGSAAGAALAGGFGFSVARHWDSGSALEGRYEWFGLLVLAEVLAAAAGAVYLIRKKRSRWIAWWVGLVVALHFVPLALLLADLSLVLLGAIQTAGLLLLVRPLRHQKQATSRLVGPLMGLTLLAFGLVSAMLFIAGEGSPW